MIRYLLITVTLVATILSGDVWSEASDKPELLKQALQAMGGAEEIVFAVRGLYAAAQPNANYGRWSDAEKYAHSPDGSRLCKINLRTGKVSVLLDDPKGGIRDPRVHYDGNKILFAYRKGGTHHYHLCEINTDGSGLRQLTFGEYDDTDPAYLPDGGIVFVSTRSNRFVPCQQFQAGILYRMDADGGNMLCLSANNVIDDRPAVLPDGRIIYTRWEYVDRGAQQFRDLWAMNPDGTAQILFFGPVRPHPKYFAKCDALPIPGTDKIVSVFSPALGHQENAGKVMVVDLKSGPEDWSAARQISPEAQLVWTTGNRYGRQGYRDPYPLCEDCFLVAQDKSLYILDENGNTNEFYHADKMVHDPRVIRPRPREPVIPYRIDLGKTSGQLVLADVYRGRNMKGVKPGDIKKLLVLEDLPKPASYRNNGLNPWVGYRTLTLRRILGTVPVEADGSASFEAPALRGIYFVALDEKGLAVKRMQSYTMLMPGETQGCVGCHEPRTQTIMPKTGYSALMALKRPPSLIEPVSGIPEVIDYHRDVQPIWDRNCVSCHSADNPSGHVILTGDNSEWHTQSYEMLFAHGQISAAMDGGNHAPWKFGSAASPLMRLIDNSHKDVKLTEHERDIVRLWIESSAPFSGTYALNFNPQTNAVTNEMEKVYYTQYPLLLGIGKPIGPILENRCISCHGTPKRIGTRELSVWGKQTKGYHNQFNLSHPEKSLILLAPLAKEAGGYGWCKPGKEKAEDGKTKAVFQNTHDPDYQAILNAIQATKARQEKSGRIDTPRFPPSEHYIYWMKHYGILPESFDPAKDSFDPYETDKAYWRLLWHHPPTDKNGPNNVAATKRKTK